MIKRIAGTRSWQCFSLLAALRLSFLTRTFFPFAPIDSLARVMNMDCFTRARHSIQPTWSRAIIAGLCITSKRRSSSTAEPAYVGALQRDLHRLGYYCGPIDGVFTAASLRCHRPPSEKLFHARDWNFDRFRYGGRYIYLSHMETKGRESTPGTARDDRIVLPGRTGVTHSEWRASFRESGIERCSGILAVEFQCKHGGVAGASPSNSLHEHLARPAALHHRVMKSAASQSLINLLLEGGVASREEAIQLAQNLNGGSWTTQVLDSGKVDEQKFLAAIGKFFPRAVSSARCQNHRPADALDPAVAFCFSASHPADRAKRKARSRWRPTIFLIPPAGSLSVNC